MKKFFSKGFFLGFLITSALAFILYLVFFITAPLKTPSMTLASTVMTLTIATALFGGIIGRRIYIFWQHGSKKAFGFISLFLYFLA